jgi:oxygen-dependent protoporphyrinogen oxidase
MSARRRVVIVGGGISGLAAAHALRTAPDSATRFDVVVLEASDRLGGNLRTLRRDGFLLDEGPDSWVAQKPHATALVKALGLGDALIETIPANRRVYVATKDGLVTQPQGLFLGIPSRIRPLLRSPLLTPLGKARVLLDLVLPQGYGRKPGDDEAVGDFVRRRLGQEALDRIAGPLLGGLFSGDVSDLSLMSTYPQIAALEKKGSLILGARALMPKPAKAKKGATGPAAPPRSPFASLRDGMGSLVDALERALADVVRREVRVARVEAGNDGAKYAVVDTKGRSYAADEVVLSGPAHLAATLIKGFDAAVADDLSSIPYGSAVAAFLAFRNADLGRALDATGYLVPRDLGRDVVASTWVSSKWPGRAPEGNALIRCFFAERHLEADDATLTRLALEEARATIGARGEPLFAHVARFTRGSPQPRVGHAALVARVKGRLGAHGGLHLAGSAYDGVGISDCVRQAQQVADAIART